MALSLLDRFAVVELTNRFNQLQQDGRLEAVAELFTEDGVLDHPLAFARGRTAVLALLGGRGDLGPQGPFRQNQINHVVEEGPDDGAVCTSALLVIQVTDGHGHPVNPLIDVWSAVRDELVRDGDGWLIARRTIDRTASNDRGIADPAVRTRMLLPAAERGPGQQVLPNGTTR